MAIAGCGAPSNLVSISGDVKLDGKPLQNGTVVIAPVAANTPAKVYSIDNGHFESTEDSLLEPGVYRLEISSYKTTGRMITDPDSLNGAKIPEENNIIPQIYNARSNLLVEITKENSPLNLELKSN